MFLAFYDVSRNKFSHKHMNMEYKTSRWLFLEYSSELCKGYMAIVKLHIGRIVTVVSMVQSSTIKHKLKI